MFDSFVIVPTRSDNKSLPKGMIKRLLSLIKIRIFINQSPKKRRKPVLNVHQNVIKHKGSLLNCKRKLEISTLLKADIFMLERLEINGNPIMYLMML
ncbi:MAG: hypothetical protein LBE62_09310 [Azonexus sp.]|jgi:hypothetical protein|nr:hypothetical protein [Azonexus sp.]